MTDMQFTQHIDAPRSAVWRALIDPEAIARWRVPDGMTCTVHDLEPHEGGTFRISLSYDDPSRAGKSSGHTDTYHGRYERLVTDERVVEVDEFETDDPELQGEMRITFDLSESDGGTDLEATHEGLPPGVLPADNEVGWRMSLAKLSGMFRSS